MNSLRVICSAWTRTMLSFYGLLANRAQNPVTAPWFLLQLRHQAVRLISHRAGSLWM